MSTKRVALVTGAVVLPKNICVCVPEHELLPLDAKFSNVAGLEGQGIGRAIALQLAREGYLEGLGVVAVNDIAANAENVRSVAEELKARNVGSTVHIADVSLEEQVKGMIEDVVKEHGSLDVMIANAGVALYCPIVDTTVAEWDRVFSINVRGTFLCYKYAGKQMIAQGRGGRIIGACSFAGKRGAGNYSAYCGSKFAVRGITQAAALEFSSYGITVNAFAPGPVETDMMNYLDDETTKASGAQTGDHLKAMASRTPLGRNGTVTDIANLVTYLVSSKADFITGQSISCNGGLYFD